jgi:hypothetical protein
MTGDDEKKRLMKEAWKEAFKEVMVAEYASIGRSAVKLIVLGILGVIAYLILWKMGWTPPEGSPKP